MARIITKQLALRIVRKLDAVKIDSKRKAHDLYAVEFGGIEFATISIRRGSDKNLGHDYLPRDLHISPNQAKRLGQCTWSYDEFIQEMRDKGIIHEDQV